MFRKKFKNKVSIKNIKFFQEQIKNSKQVVAAFNKLLIKNRMYIVGVSGGPDSMFSLEKMWSEGYNLVVAHVNYKKRASSDYDEQIVKNYCQKYSLLYEVYHSKNIPKGNFQAQARRIRYTFFQQLATKYQTKYIIVAHHFDDHLETYLLQKQRHSLVDY